MPVATMVSSTLGLNPVIESLGLQNNSAVVPQGQLISQLNLAFTAATQANDAGKVQGTRTIQIATHLTGTYVSGTHAGVYAIAYDDQTSPGTVTHVFGVVGRAYNTASGSIDGSGSGFLSGIYGSCEVDAGAVDNACSLYGNGITLTGGTVTNYFGGYLAEVSAAPTGGTITSSFGLFVQMPTHGGTNNCGIQIGSGPVGVNAGFYNNSTTTLVGQVSFIPAVTLTSGTYHGVDLAGTYTPGGASTLAMIHLDIEPTYNANAANTGSFQAINANLLNSGGNTISAAYVINSQLSLSGNSVYTSGYGLQINSPSIASGSSISTAAYGAYIQAQFATNGNTSTSGGFSCYGLRIDEPSQGGNTSGTNNNYGLFMTSGAGGASGSGGTVANYRIIVAVPNPVGAGTNNNFGIAISGAGGSGGTTNNWALYVSSTAPSTFACPVYIGGTVAAAASTLTLADAWNIVFGTTTGTKIGTVGGAAGQKIGFWNATPIVQPVLATGASHTVDDVITVLQNLGLCRQS